MTSQEMERNIQEIWDLFRATDQRLKELGEETDRRIKETDQRIKETNEQMRKTDRRLSEEFAKTGQRLSEEFAKTEQQLRKMSKNVGDLGNSWGDFVEGLVVPAVKKGLFEKYGIPVNHISERRKEHKGDEVMEMDVIAINGDKVVVIEVKSRATKRHVDKHVKKLARFKEFFKDHKDKIILGGIAGATFDSGADNHAINKGLFVIKQRGDHVEVTNREEFRPKEW